MGPHQRTAWQARPLGVRPLDTPYRPPLYAQLVAPARFTLGSARARQERDGSDARAQQEVEGGVALSRLVWEGATVFA